MNKRILYLALIFGLLSLQAECGKNEPGKYIQNDTTFLSYWYFPENSYWIYKDSLSSEYDTFRITRSYSREQLQRHSSDKVEFNVIAMLNQGIEKTQIGQPREYDVSQYIYFLDESWNNGSAIRFFYTKNNSATNLENHLFQKHIDSISINGRYFNDIYCLINKDNQGNDDTVRIEYYARNIGIIKRVYENGRVWELDKYYIAP